MYGVVITAQAAAGHIHGKDQLLYTMWALLLEDKEGSTSGGYSSSKDIQFSWEYKKYNQALIAFAGQKLLWGQMY